MLQPKFKIGDVVFGAWSVRLNNKLTCPDCLGSAEWSITTPAGETFPVRCSTCNEGWYSTGKVDNWEFTPITEKMTIGAVRTDTTKEKDEQISYMCNETGVGSGRIHYEKYLFSSQDEATSVAMSLTEKRKSEELAEFERKRKRDKDKSNLQHKPRAK